MKKSFLGAVALGVGGAAVAGFGASAGRDLYKSIKRSTGFIILLVAVAGALILPFVGMRNLLRGHAPGEWWKGIGDVLLVPTGIGIGVGVALFIGLIMGNEPMAMSFIAIAVAAIAGATIGFSTGLIQRPSTQRRYAIALQNEQFLSARSIRETGETETTHYDADGNALRLIERTSNSIVFLAVGKRNKRAYIGLTKEGKMTDYTGVVSLGAPRNMDTVA